MVCVVVQGAAWQFKEFKWKQPVNLFQHVLGIHLKYDDVELEPRVAGWNVQVVQISKDKRHLDKVVCIYMQHFGYSHSCVCCCCCPVGDEGVSGASYRCCRVIIIDSL